MMFSFNGLPCRSQNTSGPRRWRAAWTSRSKSSKSWKAAEGGGTGSKRTAHGIRSMTPHSTAFLRTVFSTVKTLLTVFGVLLVSVQLSATTESRISSLGGLDDEATPQAVTETSSASSDLRLWLGLRHVRLRRSFQMVVYSGQPFVRHQTKSN